MASTEVNTLFSVKGRVALVTGGTSGIGLMIAKVSYFTFQKYKLMQVRGWSQTERKSMFADYLMT
jgi:hypothetical protein